MTFLPVRPSLTFIITAGLYCIGIQSAAAADNWQRLFNGRDLSDWKTYLPADSQKKPEEVWTVRDQTIICEGSPSGYIITDKEYENYVLRFKCRWGQKIASGRNSGVLVHVTGPDRLWPKGAEAQLMSGAAGDFWLLDGFKLTVDASRKDPKVSNHYFRTKNQVEKPIGEWNDYEVTCTTNTIRLAINGQVVNEGTEPENAKGRILLQSEGAEIHFRDIEIKSLP